MPTYEYRCKDCGHTFDAYQAFTDDPLTECPECSGTVKKVFGNVGISFKGSGFYKTDSRSSSGSGSASGGNGSSKDSSGDSSTSSGDGGSTGASKDSSSGGSGSSDSGAKATSGTGSSSGG